MKGFQKIVSCLLMVSFITGCAVSNSRMIKDGNSLSDVKFCRNYLNDYRDLMAKFAGKTITSDELGYFSALKVQKKQRNLTRMNCEGLVKKKNTANAGAVIGVLAIIVAVAATAAAAKSGGGAGYSGNTGYAWDQFYDGHRNLIWRCRDKSNGEFAYDFNCGSAYKVDSTWPAK